MGFPVCSSVDLAIRLKQYPFKYSLRKLYLALLSLPSHLLPFKATLGDISFFVHTKMFFSYAKTHHFQLFRLLASYNLLMEVEQQTRFELAMITTLEVWPLQPLGYYCKLMNYEEFTIVLRPIVFIYRFEPSKGKLAKLNSWPSKRSGGEYENRTRLIFLFAREVSTPCTPIPHKILFERFKWSKSIPVHNTTRDYFRFIYIALSND